MDKHTVSGILTDDQVTVLAVALGKGQEAFSAGDVKIVVGWAEEVLLASSLLDAVISGKINLQVENGEVMFISNTDK